MKSIEKRFNDKVAVVTGTGAGVGRQFALDLAREGADVVVTDIDHDAMDRVVAEIEHAGGQALGIACDVASIAGKRGDNSTIFVYGASKGVVISLTRSTARELGPFGITCNAVAPHSIMTRMMSYWDDDKKESVTAQIPVRRLGTPEDVSRLVLFLASDESSFITGETLNINGGYYMD